MLDLGHENYSHYCCIILCHWLRLNNKILVHEVQNQSMRPSQHLGYGRSNFQKLVGMKKYDTVPNVETSVKEATNASNDDTFVKEMLDNLEEMLGDWTESNEMLSVHVQCMLKRICDLCSAAADSRSMSPTKSVSCRCLKSKSERDK